MFFHFFRLLTPILCLLGAYYQNRLQSINLLNEIGVLSGNCVCFDLKNHIFMFVCVIYRSSACFGTKGGQSIVRLDALSGQ